MLTFSNKSFYYIFSGKIAFIGPTEFATGIWIGIELDSAIGKQKIEIKLVHIVLYFVFSLLFLSLAVIIDEFRC